MNAAQAWRYVQAWRGLAEALALQAVQAWSCSTTSSPVVHQALRRAWRAQVRHRMALARWAEIHRTERLREEASDGRVS